MKQNKYWNPARFGAKQENEVSCWALGVGWLPKHLLEEIPKWLDDATKYNGFVGVRPEFPRGMLLVFKTENDAKLANKQLIAKGVPTGGIAECYIPKEVVERAVENGKENKS